MPDNLTLTDLRRHFGQPRHILNYALETYGPEPTFRVGYMRFWSRDVLPHIEAALAKTARQSRKADRRISQTTSA